MTPRTATTRKSKPAVKRKAAGVRTIAFVSLGCPKNLVDSEKMLGLLAEDGLMPVSDEGQADAIVVNTCGFLEASRLESVEEINRAAQLKKQGSCKRLIVAGCLVQRHRAKMLEWCPDIDAMIGVFDRDHIVEAVRGSKPTQNDLHMELPVYSSIAANATIARRQRGLEKDPAAQGYFESDAARLRLTPRHYAYLRISEGCNQNCAFCTIPSIRGKMRSKPVDRILNEARELMNDGVFELNLIGQDTTSYGEDIGYKPEGQDGLVAMLTALDSQVAQFGGGWIRLMYAYPSCFTDAMIDAIAALPRVVKYIDMPLQHINNTVLTHMRRRTSRKLIETLLAKLRQRVPGMAIRTTFISGFPGETQRQHNELVKFVREFGFDAMGVFPYSPEPGTPAGTLHAQGGAIEQSVIDARIEELMLTQQQVVFARHDQWVKQQAEFEVLIDAPAGSDVSLTPKARHAYVGRTPAQAPQIDGVTYVHSRTKLATGDLVRCRVTHTKDYDLIAQPLTDIHRQTSLTVLR
jgi:ribosomal protein S12 methylthiotransferase